MKIDVLDKGHVQYMDHMGTDLTVVNAARVSFDKESEWLPGGVGSSEDDPAWLGHYYEDSYTDGPVPVLKELYERDTKLINYLAKHDHWTPFGQCNLQLRIKMPIFVARQMMRSNIGIVWNEVSRRYVDSDPEFYEPDVWRGRPEGSIKQGSGADEVTHWTWCDPVTGIVGQEPRELSEVFPHHMQQQKAYYKSMLLAGVCPEQARMVLPQSTYTEVVGNFTLAALARVYTQRADSHAQWEIQQYALAMGEIASKYFPVSWEALTQ